MSSGAEHYKEAEALMARAHDMEDEKPRNDDMLPSAERRVDFIMARANLHAELAKAAATIELAYATCAQDVRQDWLEAVQ